MSETRYLKEKISNRETRLLMDLYGSDPHDLQKQTDTYISLINNFERVFNGKDPQLFSSPGRTEIGGNHTDHNNGRVLAGSVSLDNIAIASRNSLDKIRIESEGYLPVEIDCSELSPKKGERFSSASLVRGVVAGIRDMGLRYGGFDACIKGRVPKGSGLSSSASFEVLIGTIINHLFNGGNLDPLDNAIIGQKAENNFFGKPCGLMDQTACAVGGLITIDFRDPGNPLVNKVDFDFTVTGYSLVITDTGGDHANLNDEYASLPAEMKSVASALGAEFLREVKLKDIVKAIPELRPVTGDRAILRAYHFQEDNQRVVRQVEALERGDFRSFLNMVVESGYSSFMYNQNIHSSQSVKVQGVALGLAISEMVLKGEGAWRVHGGGFAGTIQAFVPDALLDRYIKTMEHVFGNGSCYNLFIRNNGAFRLQF